MKSMRNEQTELLFEAILSLSSVEECCLFFEDVCTIKELQAMSQRFQVACQLDAEKNYNQVYKDTGVSSATISRVNKCLLYGNGGYKLALDRLKQSGRLRDGKANDSEK